MTMDRRYFVAYELSKYMRENNMLIEMEEYQFVQHVSTLAKAIKYAIEYHDKSVIKFHRELLNEELEKLQDENQIENVKKLLALLDECK